MKKEEVIEKTTAYVKKNLAEAEGGHDGGIYTEFGRPLNILP